MKSIDAKTSLEEFVVGTVVFVGILMVKKNWVSVVAVWDFVVVVIVAVTVTVTITVQFVVVAAVVVIVPVVENVESVVVLSLHD